MSQQHQIKAVLFDMGGVVLEYTDLQKYSTFYKMGKIRTFARISFFSSLKIEANVELRRQYMEFECGQLTIYDMDVELLAYFGVVSLLKNLKKNKKFYSKIF